MRSDLLSLRPLHITDPLCISKLNLDYKLTKSTDKEPLVLYEDSGDLGCLIWTIPFAGLSIWSGLKNHTFWMIFGIIVIILIIKAVYDSYTNSIKFNNWISNNTGTVILFYPTKKEKQNAIKNKIGTKINRSIKQMYYEKSKIIGDIKFEQFIDMGLGQLNRVNPNHPRLIQINGNILVELINLYELNRITKLDQSRINQIIEEINTYA